MCGIIGAISSDQNIIPLLINGLMHLEYRGYDSSGIAVHAQNSIIRIRKVGRVREMAIKVEKSGITSCLGIGHTRWATHGKVTEKNAHPHVSKGLISVVHNGIIENFEDERSRLKNKAYSFESQTDTEVIAHRIHYEYLKDHDLFNAVKRAKKCFKGAYSIVVMANDQPDKIIGVRMGCPLLVAFSNDVMLLASDVSAVIQETRKVLFLEDGDIVELNAKGIVLFEDDKGNFVERNIHYSELSVSSLELGIYNHYMQKEIAEQPKAISDTLEKILIEGFTPELFGEKAREIFANIRNIKILACGSSYYAGLTAKYWLEGIAKLPTDVEVASEYRYREALMNSTQLVITISQSGETLDTLEALKYAYQLGAQYTLSISNVLESSLPRESNLVFYTRAGIEIGVASTKALSTQLVSLFTLAITLAKLHHKIDENEALNYLEQLRYLPGTIQHTLNLEPQIMQWANYFATRNNALFLGRGIHYPIALEGALKLKEISYIHAEAYPSGELKHGPLALIDHDIPVVVIAPNDKLLEKVKSNMQEVAARGGELFAFTDLDSNLVSSKEVHLIRTPRNVGILSPIVHLIPVQLLAYHTALIRDTDVDKPRNLAKSVTVE